MNKRKFPSLKPLFLERMQKLLPDKKDFQDYLEILKIPPVKSIRCNKIKISPKELKKKLEDKKWKIKQPYKDYPEVMVVENNLEPGELGRALEHLLGYYYIQELASMLPVIALQPKESEKILDLCSAPGSKTTQIASEMKNSGSIIANEVSLGRIKILASNLERCGVTNTIITKKDGVAFCNRIKKYNPELKFSKILVDAPCSGEGTLRSSPKTYAMWNIKTIKALSRIQKQLVLLAFEILKSGGELVYSTCTHAPEENEEVVDYILNEFSNVKLEKISLPIKTREGIIKWERKEFLQEVKKCARIYPQDNNTEGFFIAKFRKLK
ncbi:RsmB/NOP family class I SAM-dependent RNA methyltransferase [Candidatus Pacearchaeota archaeon]|nr:RsmB/NOP family class I SAM-dependent RNA methyltransferase [Candidatus Pacearchaeota archaeon]